MPIIINCQNKILHMGNAAYPCRIGKRGYIAGEKGREGDAKTPLGTYHLRFGFYRADRLPAPRSPLTFHALSENDGWCDDPNDSAYNRYVRLPYPANHEKLWRDDGAYDIILVISHNDSPPKKGLGSAVFIHIAQPDDRQTLGCVAVTPDVMAGMLPRLAAGMQIIIAD